ncbi:hypothetical protein [Nocardia sp. alder85J]|uniref:hypothetical protein n=1 Tax=Nocardia sp. alder85J TaxID=2862949 RepID=UPI001CD57D1A|nr:hypothetical protein [Nocardia sp. alder85J]MCX4099075.1 hypothetical protein [Nocardia sp. alder85J]
MLETAANSTSQYGLRAPILAIGSSRSHHLFRYLGLPQKDKRPMTISLEIVEASRLAILDPPVHAALRSAQNAGRARRKVEIQLEETQRIVQKMSDSINSETLKSRLQTIEDLIDQTCNKHERKIRRGQALMGIKRFILLITGAAKAAENVTISLASTADKIVKDLGSD